VFEVVVEEERRGRKREDGIQEHRESNSSEYVFDKYPTLGKTKSPQQLS
jgi:hypothetical protein